MFTVNDLVGMLEQYEKEKLFIEAKIAVVGEMIGIAQAMPCNACEEKVEVAVEPYEVNDNVVVDESY